MEWVVVVSTIGCLFALNWPPFHILFLTFFSKYRDSNLTKTAAVNAMKPLLPIQSCPDRRKNRVDQEPTGNTLDIRLEWTRKYGQTDDGRYIMCAYRALFAVVFRRRQRQTNI